jgi:hypothetical protein
LVAYLPEQDVSGAAQTHLDAALIHTPVMHTVWVCDGLVVVSIRDPRCPQEDPKVCLGSIYLFKKNEIYTFIGSVLVWTK